MVAQRGFVLLAKARFLLGRHVKKQLHGVIGSMPDLGSGGGGFDPHQTPKCFNSTVVVQLTCNEQVVGPNPT